MKELFPRKQVTGFVFSLILTAVALTVYYFDLSFEVGATILLITAFTQAIVQLVVFMHAGETGDKKAIYTSIIYGGLLAVVTIFGSLLTLVWAYY